MLDNTDFIPLLIWLVAGVALLGTVELMNPFVAMALAVPGLLAYLGVTILLLAAYTRNALRNRTKGSWVAVAAIPTSLATLVLMSAYLGRVAMYAQFAAMLPTYSRIVDAVTQQRQYDAKPELRYIVDQGPPVRIAFPKAGIVDNWWGFVYDRSDAVAQARGWNVVDGEYRFTAPEEIKGLFGGDLLACKHLYSHYYSCSFT